MFVMWLALGGRYHRHYELYFHVSLLWVCTYVLNGSVRDARTTLFVFFPDVN